MPSRKLKQAFSFWNQRRHDDKALINRRLIAIPAIADGEGWEPVKVLLTKIALLIDASQVSSRIFGISAEKT